MLLFGAFSIIALILAAVGIHGVVSYSVARWTREMGIRLALGAEGGHVRRMVVMASMRMVLVGLVFGAVLGGVPHERWSRGPLACGTRGMLYKAHPESACSLSPALDYGLVRLSKDVAP